MIQKMHDMYTFWWCIFQSAMSVHESVSFNPLSRYLETFYFHHVCVIHLATNHQRREPSLKAAIALLTSHFPIYRPALVFSPPNSQPPLTTCSQLHFTESSPRKRSMGVVAASGKPVRVLFVILLEDLGRNHNKSNIHIQV